MLRLAHKPQRFIACAAVLHKQYALCLRNPNSVAAVLHQFPCRSSSATPHHRALRSNSQPPKLGSASAVRSGVTRPTPSRSAGDRAAAAAAELQTAAAQMQAELRKALAAADFDSLTMMCADAATMRASAVAEAGEAARSKHIDIDTICIQELARRAALLCAGGRGAGAAGAAPQPSRSDVLGWFKAAAALAYRVPSAAQGAEREVPLLERALPSLEADLTAGGASASIAAFLDRATQHVAAGWLSSDAARMLLPAAAQMLELAASVLILLPPPPSSEAVQASSDSDSHSHSHSLLLHVQLPIRVYVAVAGRPPPPRSDLAALDLRARSADALAFLITRDATLALWVSASAAPGQKPAPPLRRLAVGLDALVALIQAPQEVLLRARPRQALGRLTAVLATAIAEGAFNSLHTGTRVAAGVTVARMLGWRRLRCAALVAELQPHILAEARAIAHAADEAAAAHSSGTAPPTLAADHRGRAISTAAVVPRSAQCGNEAQPVPLPLPVPVLQRVHGLVWRLRTLTALCRLLRLASTIDGRVLLGASRAGMKVHALAMQAGLLPTPAAQSGAAAAAAAHSSEAAPAIIGLSLGEGEGLRLLPDSMRNAASTSTSTAGSADDDLGLELGLGLGLVGASPVDVDVDVDAGAAPGLGSVSVSHLQVHFSDGLFGSVTLRQRGSSGSETATASAPASASPSGRTAMSEADARVTLLYSLFGVYADAVKAAAATAGKPAPALARLPRTPTSRDAGAGAGAGGEPPVLQLQLRAEDALLAMRSYAAACAWAAHACLPPVWPLLRVPPPHADAAALFGRRVLPNLLLAHVPPQQRFAAALADHQLAAMIRALQTLVFAASQISVSGRRALGPDLTLPQVLLRDSEGLRRRIFAFLHYAAFGKPLTAFGAGAGTVAGAPQWCSPAAAAAAAAGFEGIAAAAGRSRTGEAQAQAQARGSSATDPRGTSGGAEPEHAQARWQAPFSGADLVQQLAGGSTGNIARTSAARTANALHSVFLAAVHMGLMQPVAVSGRHARSHGADDGVARRAADGGPGGGPGAAVMVSESAHRRDHGDHGDGDGYAAAWPALAHGTGTAQGQGAGLTAVAAFPHWLAQLLLEFREAGGNELLWSRLPQKFVLMGKGKGKSNGASKGHGIMNGEDGDGGSRGGAAAEASAIGSETGVLTAEEARDPQVAAALAAPSLSLPADELGFTRAKPAAAHRSAYARSFFEASAFKAVEAECARRGLPPPRLNWGLTSLGVECDMAWPHARVIVAVDGPLHYPLAPVLDIAMSDRLRSERPWKLRTPAACAEVAAESDTLPLDHLRQWLASALARAQELGASGQHRFAGKAARSAWDGPLRPLDVITRGALRRAGWHVACVSVLHVPDMFFAKSRFAGQAQALAQPEETRQGQGQDQSDDHGHGHGHGHGCHHADAPPQPQPASEQPWYAALTAPAKVLPAAPASGSGFGSHGSGSASGRIVTSVGYELGQEVEAMMVAALEEQGVWAALKKARSESTTAAAPA